MCSNIWENPIRTHEYSGHPYKGEKLGSLCPFSPFCFDHTTLANYRLLLLPIRSIRIWSVPNEHFLKCSGFAFCYLFYGLVFQSSPINPSTLCLLTKRLLLLKYCPPAKYKTTQKMHLNRWSLACSPRFRVVNHITTKNIHTKKVLGQGDFLQVKNIWWQFFSVLACMHNAEFPFPKFENWAPLLVTVLLHDNSDDDDHHQRRVVCSRWKFHLTLASIFPKLIRILLVMASQCWLDKCNFGGENPGCQKVIW